VPAPCAGGIKPFGVVTLGQAENADRRDKAKVEVSVQVVQRWIPARLCNRRFFSLAELNWAVRALADQLNDRPTRGWNTTRRGLFEQLDRPALLALPPTPYEYADWKRCRVVCRDARE